MPRCYNIVLDSTVSHDSANTTIVNRQYFVNWDGLMPLGSYKVSFSFMSEAAVHFGAVIMGIQANLGGNDTYQAGTDFCTTSRYLGSARITAMNADEYMSCNLTDNPPLYLAQRPNINHLTIWLTNGITFSPYTTPAPADYVLMLHFEEMSLTY